MNGGSNGCFGALVALARLGTAELTSHMAAEGSWGFGFAASCAGLTKIGDPNTKSPNGRIPLY